MIPVIEVGCSGFVCLACWREADHATKAVNKTQSKKDPKWMSYDVLIFFWEAERVGVFGTDICNEFPLVFEFVSDYLMTNDAKDQQTHDIVVLHSHTSQLRLPRCMASYFILEPGPRYTSNSYEKQKLAQEELEKEAVRDQSGTLAKWGVIWAQGCDASLHNAKLNSTRLQQQSILWKSMEETPKQLQRLLKITARLLCWWRLHPLIHPEPYRWKPFARRWRMWWDGTCGQPCCAQNTLCRKLKLLSLFFCHGTVCVRYNNYRNCLYMTKSGKQTFTESEAISRFWHVLPWHDVSAPVEGFCAYKLGLRMNKCQALLLKNAYFLMKQS